MLLHTNTFYIQTLLHIEAFTHSGFYIQTFLHTDALTHRRFYTERLFTYRHTGTDTHAHRETDTGRTNKNTDRHQGTHTHRDTHSEVIVVVATSAIIVWVDLCSLIVSTAPKPARHS